MRLYVFIFTELYCPHFDCVDCAFTPSSYELSSSTQIICEPGFCNSLMESEQITTCIVAIEGCRLAWSQILACEGRDMLFLRYICT